MLPKYYRFRLLWIADQTLTYANAARVTISFMQWKLSSGNLAYKAEQTDNFGFTTGTIVTSGEVESTVVDNSSDLYWGLKGTLKVIADVNSTDGTMYMYVEFSEDNSYWPSDKADFDINDLLQICALDMSTDAEDEERAKNFKYGM